MISALNMADGKKEKKKRAQVKMVCTEMAW